MTFNAKIVPYIPVLGLWIVMGYLIAIPSSKWDTAPDFGVQSRNFNYWASMFVQVVSNVAAFIYIFT